MYVIFRYLLFPCSSVDGVLVDAEHEAVLLDASVDDDHDDEGDDEEEQEHDVDGRVSLSRALRQLRLQLRALAGLELAQVHGGEARQVRAGHHAPPAVTVVFRCDSISTV